MILPVKHNLFNNLASAVTNNFENMSYALREKLGIPFNQEHSLEYVATINGVQFINDSKATNPNRTWFSLSCMPRQVVWIAGGIDKGNDYYKIIPLVEHIVSVIVCLGFDNRRIHQCFSNRVELIVNTTSMKEAVKMAYYFAYSDKTVLLSPACASFDLFENYEDRGCQFKKEVRRL